MRLIEIDEFSTVELWRGRRLYLEDATGPRIVTLPKGAMHCSGNKTISFLYFGGSNGSQVQVSGSVKRGRVAAFAAGVVESERPGAQFVRSLK